MAPTDIDVQVIGGNDFTIPFSSLVDGVIAWSDNPDILFRPCVDCGLKTGYFCDFCKAKDRLPNEVWADNQFTPLCTRCDHMYYACHFCRKTIWCAPPPSIEREDTEHTRAADDILQSQRRGQ